MSILATQSQQEAASSDFVVVTPAIQHFHPSASKFWVKAAGNSATIVTSYNMTSWADTATGQATGTIATDFSSADWCGLATPIIASNGWNATYMTAVGFQSVAAGTFRIDCSRMQDGATAVAAYLDPDSWLVYALGDQ